jgi:ABC-type sugar transport system permease subunit
LSRPTYDGSTPPAYVGLDNYARLAADDAAVASLGVTLKYGVLALPVLTLAGLGLALLVNARRLRGASAFRSLFFLPYVVPLVAAVIAWDQMLNPVSGWVNGILRAVGVTDPPAWLLDPGWVYPGLVLIGLWTIGYGFLVNLAALRGVPTELYDAARVDGAGPWRTFRNVTLPMISPALFFVVVVAVVEVFQYFLVPLILNQGTGGPDGATSFFNLYLYKTFFTYQDMSYGATLAVALFVVILLVTGGLFLASRRWVYYASDR